MAYTNIKKRLIAKLALAVLFTNIISPTLQSVFANNTQYYIDADGGSDANDGLTPATPWQSLARMNASGGLLPGDIVSLDCNDSWNETLTLSGVNGIPGSPITVNGYGTGCVSNKPTVNQAAVINSSFINLTGLEANNPSLGAAAGIVNSSVVNFSDMTLSYGSGYCLGINNSTGTTISTSALSGCNSGVLIDVSEVTFSNNSITNINQDAIIVNSSLSVTIEQNVISQITGNAILYGSNTQVGQNTIINSCTGNGNDCAAIKNHSSISGPTSTIITDNIIQNSGSGVIGNFGYGISLSNISNTQVLNNSIINTNIALRLLNSSGSNLVGNMLLNSRQNSVVVKQDTVGATRTNTLSGNTLLQKNPDYPYIEIRDEVPGSENSLNFLSAMRNTVYPLYKPNSSYVRMVDFGGFTREFTKDTLSLFDPTVSKFEYFAYRPYTSTGTFATANLLSNPNFDIDASGWIASANTGSTPTLTYNPFGTQSGGSLTVTPTGGAPDRIWISNDATFSISQGQTYLVTGYARSATGTLNLRAFLHQSGSQSNTYSDRIAETTATMSGNTFSFYLTSTVNAVDAQISFETSNQNVSYEIDTLSVRRINGLAKNTNSLETLIFTNTGNAILSQTCPGGVPCAAYVDSINSAVSFPFDIAPYSSRIIFWNNSPNILRTPLCSLNPSQGSLPTGQPVNVDWTVTNSLSQELTYTTYTGTISSPVSQTGTVTFIPPYNVVSTIILNNINDVGPSQCSVQVTTTNTPPNIYPGTSTGAEDSPQITGTLSGVDLNPGDSIFFEQSGNLPSNGTVSVDFSGSFQYVPNPNFCGTDSFQFRAYDQLNNRADSVDQTMSVTCVNDTPQVANDTASGVAGVMQLINVMANDTDIDNLYQTQTLTLTGYTNPSNGTLAVNGTRFEYTPNVGFSGSDSFMYQIVDQDMAYSNTGIVTINVRLPNDAPIAIPTTYTFDEDTTLTNTLSGTDANGDVLSFTATILPANGTLTLGTNGSFTYVPNANFFGADSFRFIISDGVDQSSGATVSLTINSINDTPVVNNDSYSVFQDQMRFLPVLENDVDPDSPALTLTGFSSPTNGTLVVSGTGFEYTPNTSYTGSDSFTYRVVDDTGLLSLVGTVSLNVVLSNNPPVASPLSFSLNEEGTLAGTLSGSDIEMSSLTYIVDTLPANGILVASSTGSFTYTPNANYNGTDTFNYRVSDGLLSSTAQTVTITVNPINDAPVALSGSYTAYANTLSSTGNILSGTLSATDIDSALLTFSISSPTANGVLSLSSTGGFQYTPALGFTGTDSFSFVVSDGVLLSTVATVTINVIEYIAPPPLPVITLTASPSSIAQNATSIVSWSTLNAYVCTGVGTGTVGVFTTPALTTNTTYSLSCTGTGGTVTSNVTINVAPPPNSGSPMVGGGGGGGGNIGMPVKQPSSINTSSAESLTFNSAPSSAPSPVFSMDDPTGLLSQLMLMKNIALSSVRPEKMEEQTDTSPEPSEDLKTLSAPRNQITLFDDIDESMFDERTGTVILRNLMRMFIAQIAIIDDPIFEIDSAVDQITRLDFSDSERLILTQQFILRLLDQQRQKYEQMVEVYAANSIRREEFEEVENGGNEDNSGSSSVFVERQEPANIPQINSTDSQNSMIFSLDPTINNLYKQLNISNLIK